MLDACLKGRLQTQQCAFLRLGDIFITYPPIMSSAPLAAAPAALCAVRAPNAEVRTGEPRSADSAGRGRLTRPISP